MSIKVDSVVVLVKNGKTRASLAVPLRYARTLVQDVQRPPNIEFGRPMCIVRLKEWKK